MQRSAALAAFALALTLAPTLAGCHSKAEAPVEQIVVRQRGAAMVPAAAAAPAAADLVAAGKAAFATCAACHSVDPNGTVLIGPNLHGVVRRPAGSFAGFGYSRAMKNSGIVWTEAELAAFLTNPSAKVPGTLMTVGQVDDAQRRAAIIAYLASLKN